MDHSLNTNADPVSQSSSSSIDPSEVSPRSRRVRFADLPSRDQPSPSTHHPQEIHPRVQKRESKPVPSLRRYGSSSAAILESMVSPENERYSRYAPEPLRSHPPDIPAHLQKRRSNEAATRSPPPTGPLPPIPGTLTSGPPASILKQSQQEFPSCTLPGLPPHLAESKPARLAARLNGANPASSTSLNPSEFHAVDEKDGVVHYWVEVEAIAANCPGPDALPPGHWERLTEMANEVDTCQPSAGCSCTQLIKGMYSIDKPPAGESEEPGRGLGKE